MPLFGLMLFPLLGAAGFGIDLGNWYLHSLRLQNAVDAAALSGSTFLPNDYPEARDTAKESLERNNFDSTKAVITQSGVRPTEISVKMGETVKSHVIQVLGITEVRIDRKATAEYRPFVPMGSPSNVVGKEPDTPWETSGQSNKYWLNIAGGASYKSNGDRWSGGACSNSTTDRCSQATPAPFGNSDYSTEGQIYVVRVKPGVSGPLRLQAFDPAFVAVGDTCTSNFGSLAPGPNNRYAQGTTSPYCTGDQMLGASTTPTDTKFELWTPADSSGGSKPISTSTCKAASFDGYNASLQTKMSNDPNFKNYFRQWVTLCDLQIGSGWAAGDYLLHVTTPQNEGGMNRFALRAGVMTSGNTIDLTKSKNVSVFSKGRLVLYALDQSSNVNFYLARINSGAAGHTMTVTLFDIGDAANPVTVRILPPPDAKDGTKTMTGFNGCTYQRPGTNYFQNTPVLCGINNMTSATYDGKIVNIQVPIPDDYTCEDANPDACWTRINVAYSSGSVTDTTSWEVGLDGQPVHLVADSD